MWNYEKRLQYPVKITQTNPKIAQVIISQFGGPDGELAASMRYLSQRYTMPYREVIGTLTDIVHLYRYCTRYFSIKDVSKISVLKYSPFPVAFTFSRIPIGIDFNHTSTIFPL